MAIQTQWNTVLDEYQNSQDWFKDLIYIHLDNSIQKIKTPDLTTQMVNPVFQKSTTLQEEYAGFFRPFDTEDWSNIDEVTSLTQDQLNQDLSLLQSQREDTLELETEILGDEKDAKIEQAELNLDKQLNAIDSDKVQLKNKALSSLSQIEDLVADTGILSGSFKQKKKIAENAITTSLNQANYNRILAVKKSEDAKITAERNFDEAIAKSELKFDTQYETKFQSADQKKETMDLNIMLDKMDIYETWKADQIGNLAQITYSDYYMNKPDPIDPQVPYVNEVSNEAFQGCMEAGGTIDSCQEFMELVTDIQDVIPDPYTPTDQTGFFIELVDSACDLLPDWIC